MLADHKLRARHEAEQGASYALQTMQSEPTWENLLLNKAVTNTSLGDVYWNVTVVPVVDFGPAGNLTNPIPLRPTGGDPVSWDPNQEKLRHFYEIRATGVSSIYQATQRLFVEEFRMCDSIASVGKKPYVFALEGSTLFMMDPRFQWNRMADLNAKFHRQTLTGNGGDVCIAINGTATLPQMFDFKPNGGSTLAAPLPVSWDVARLRLDDLSWQLLPDPNATLGFVAQPTINGVENGVPTINANGVDVSEYKGPSMQYYEINGDLYADKTAVYCLATHHFYLRNIFQNGPNGAPIVNKPGGWYSDVAILCCQADKWSVVTDCLKVEDNMTPPVIATGPRPVQGQTSYLCGDGSQVYALGPGQGGGYAVLRADSNRFTDLDTPLFQPSFFFYKKTLRKLDTLVQGTAPSFTGLAYTPLYPSEIPAQQAQAFDPGSQHYTNTTQVKERFLSWSAGNVLNGVCVVDDDIITTGNCSITEIAKPGTVPTPAAGGGRFLSHYDGGRWQIWPSGFTGLLEGSVSMPAAGTSATYPTDFANDILAVGAFQAATPKLLRRYQVVMTAYP